MFRALGMKLQGGLEALEGLVYVEFAGGVDLLVEVLFGFEVDGREGRLYPLLVTTYRGHHLG